MPYKTQNGFTCREMDILRKKYQMLRDNSDFGSFENFLKFCAESGYKQGYMIFRHDKSKPHSDVNSYFVYRKPPVKTTKINKEDNASPTPKSPCESCKLECSIQISGCAEWRVWFQKHWDEFIHQDLKSETEKKGREFFQYEHPDLQREGIVWKP